MRPALLWPAGFSLLRSISPRSLSLITGSASGWRRSRFPRSESSKRLGSSTEKPIRSHSSCPPGGDAGGLPPPRRVSLPAPVSQRSCRAASPRGGGLRAAGCCSQHELRWGLQGVLSTSPAAARDALGPAQDHGPINFCRGCCFVVGTRQQAGLAPRASRAGPHALSSPCLSRCV